MIGQRDSRRRRVEIVEGLTDDIRYDIRAPAAGRRLLLDSHKDVGASYAVADWRDVQRPQHLDIDHFRFDALGLQLVGGGKSLADHRKAGDNGRVPAGPQDFRAARHRRLFGADRHMPLHREERLMLEDEDRIVVANRSLEHQIRLRGI